MANLRERIRNTKIVNTQSNVPLAKEFGADAPAEFNPITAPRGEHMTREVDEKLDDILAQARIDGADRNIAHRS